MHLLIPFAGSGAPACAETARSLQLPHLDSLLRRLVLAHTDAGAATSFSPPHERALARIHGMSAADGCIAWAAREAAQSGRARATEAWSWITPVHWDVGADRITMADPHALALEEMESRELLAAMQPFFAEDGMSLEYAAPVRWLARGAVFDQLPSASLDRVAGREITDWMTPAASLRRLQNEMQMLLYTHPVNDARAARGAASVNSFWVSGTGRLASNSGLQPATEEAPVVVDSLRSAALLCDWAAWAQRWKEVDHRECQRLAQLSSRGDAITLTLCGERNALALRPAQSGIAASLRRSFQKAISFGELQAQL